MSVPISLRDLESHNLFYLKWYPAHELLLWQFISVTHLPERADVGGRSRLQRQQQIYHQTSQNLKLWLFHFVMMQTIAGSSLLARSCWCSRLKWQLSLTVYSCSCLIKLLSSPEVALKQPSTSDSEVKTREHFIVLYSVCWLDTNSTTSWKKKSQHRQKVLTKVLFILVWVQIRHCCSIIKTRFALITIKHFVSLQNRTNSAEKKSHNPKNKERVALKRTPL